VQGILDLAGSGGGVVQQIVSTVSNTESTGTATFPADDTIPQNTEGTEFITCAITPTSATNRLRIFYRAQSSSSAAGTVVTALFQDSNADALCTSFEVNGSVNATRQCIINFDMVAGTTSETTFKIRKGATAASTIYFNRGTSGGVFGDTMYSTITIIEYTP